MAMAESQVSGEEHKNSLSPILNKNTWKLALTAVGLAAVCAIAGYLGFKHKELWDSITSAKEVDVHMYIHDMEESKQQLVFLQKPDELSNNNLNFLNSKNNGTNQLLICTTPECQETSKELLHSINTSVDPCHDFFNFVCGKWVQQNPIPEYSSKWNRFAQQDLLIKQYLQDLLSSEPEADDSKGLRLAKSFYKSCSNVDELDDVGLDQVVEMLDEYGGWPILSPKGEWNATDFDWMKSVADLRRLFSTSAIFSIDVHVNTNGKKFNSIHFTQPSLFLSRHYLIEPEKYENHHTAYKRLIVELASELNDVYEEESGKFESAIVANQHFSKIADDIIAFEMRIANITRDPLSLQVGLKNQSATLALQFLQAIFDNYTTDNSTAKISLKTLLGYFFNTTDDVEITDLELISISDVRYMGDMFELLQSTPLETLANYLHFRMTAWIASGTTKKMRSIVETFFNVVYGTSQSASREYTCATSAADKFPAALSLKYVDKHFSRQKQKEVMGIISNVKSALKKMISYTKKLPYVISNLAVKKLDSMRDCIGSPEWILGQNKALVDQDYDELSFEDEETYLTKLFTVRRWIHDKKMKKLRESFRYECKWSNFDGHVGAFYNVKQKSVNLPAGILQFPFYAPNRPAALNYGSIGTIAGHEITHGFTIQGWTETPDGNYTSISKCLIEQYNKYKVTGIDDNEHFINGELTLDENFPDNGGLLESFNAFNLHLISHPEERAHRLIGLEQFNAHQLFFISFASNWCAISRKEGLEEQVHTDHHTPSHIRVLGTLHNSKEFAQTWNCPVGSPMNPPDEQKCFLF